MDRHTWMYQISRVTTEYVNGVNEFITCAMEDLKNKQREHGKEDMILCPCRDCNNLKKFCNVETVRDHLFRRGFKEGYIKWIWHGEGINSSKYRSDGDNMENNEEYDADNDRLDDMIHDLEDHFMHQPDIFNSLVDDSKILLYPGCKDQFTRLSTTLRLCKLKVKHQWSDKSFTEMLKFLEDILPLNNELPISTYEAKKILCPMGMNAKKIHACPNDCVLFQNENEDLHLCPKCGASRYKREGNNSCKKGKKRPPAKVIWYLPIVERFKRLFANENDAKLLRWHAEGRKLDGMLRHPGDSPQWRTIDGKFPEFGAEPRNLRLGLCADGMNPYRTLSSTHSTWPVLLTIYNLPPWLCMKRKYIMLTLLISGPKEAGNNIDIYLQPLIEDLKLLWNNGVMVSKESASPMGKNEAFHGNNINLSDKCQNLCFLVNNLPRESATKAAAKNEEVFYFHKSNEIPVYVTREDVDEFLRLGWLNISILQIFMMYIHKLCKDLEDDSFAFMCPSVLDLAREKKNRDDVSRYMCEVMKHAKEKRIILAPYIQDKHWMLLIYCVDESAVYVFDPLKRQRNLHVKQIWELAYKIYVAYGGKRNKENNLLWHDESVQCPQQKGGTECGYFVMRYMYDIVMSSRKDPKIKWREGLGRTYTEQQISEIRDLWAEYFTHEYL